MSHDEPSSAKRSEKIAHTYVIYLAIVLLLPLLIWILFAAALGPSPTTNQNAGSRPDNSEGRLDAARQSLSRQTDLDTCRNALQQINLELNEKNLHPPKPTREQADWLRETLGLGKEELAEVESINYTRLDSPHLEQCFLLRDAAGSLEVKGVRDPSQGEAPLDRAARAFAWVMRQVRLREQPEEDIPSSFALRRGWGTARERGLIFLALLEQMGDHEAARPEFLGCLLEVPDANGSLTFWACGVVIGDGKDVYVFDPRLGLPLPGPGGKGVATLAEIRKQPDILTQLNVDAKNKYDVTTEQAKAAQARLVCPLSALAPRMRHLQEKILAPAVRVRLAVDAVGELQQLKNAFADKSASVAVDRERVTLLRRFLPPEEGGADTKQRKERYASELVPWQTMPPQFLDDRRYPSNSALGKRIRGLFAGQFLTPVLVPGQPRDLLLRGRISTAVPALVTERERWRNQMEQRANAADLDVAEQQWWEKATHLYAVILRSKQADEREKAEEQIKALWSDRQAAPLYVLLFGAAAAARNAEASYQLGLCAQEEAEQLQARLAVPARTSNEEARRLETQKARQAWEHAQNSWKQLEEEYPNHLDIVAARRMRGRAEALLGDKKAALATWRQASEKQPALEKLASLYLAGQLEKQK
jgi:hypothetical protein